MTSQLAWWRLKSPPARLFTQPFVQAQIAKTSKVRLTGLCEGNSPMTGEFPSQRASNTENVRNWCVIMESIYMFCNPSLKNMSLAVCLGSVSYKVTLTMPFVLCAMWHIFNTKTMLCILSGAFLFCECVYVLGGWPLYHNNTCYNCAVRFGCWLKRTLSSHNHLVTWKLLKPTHCLKWLTSAYQRYPVLKFLRRRLMWY